jgi:hypothetical protein
MLQPQRPAHHFGERHHQLSEAFGGQHQRACPALFVSHTDRDAPAVGGNRKFCQALCTDDCHLGPLSVPSGWWSARYISERNYALDKVRVGPIYSRLRQDEKSIMPPPESDQAIISFLENLPIAIRDNVVSRCCIAFGRLKIDDNLEQRITVLKSVRNAPDPLVKGYECAKMIGAIELALEDDGDMSELYEEFYRDHDAIEFLESSLREPLVARYFANSRKSFQTLREGHLSAPMIRKWQWHLLSEMGNTR